MAAARLRNIRAPPSRMGDREIFCSGVAARSKVVVPQVSQIKMQGFISILSLECQ
jgi:hypothetical protein